MKKWAEAGEAEALYGLIVREKVFSSDCDLVEGRKRIAHRFNRVARRCGNKSRQGRKKLYLCLRHRLGLLVLAGWSFVPGGTGYLGFSLPTVETVGYFRASLTGLRERGAA